MNVLTRYKLCRNANLHTIHRQQTDIFDAQGFSVNVPFFDKVDITAAIVEENIKDAKTVRCGTLRTLGTMTGIF